MEMRRRDYPMASEDRAYTVEDIIALPEGQRAELFDGKMLGNTGSFCSFFKR